MNDTYCKKCDAVTPRRKDGYCKTCDKLRSREYRKAHPEITKQQDLRRWARKTPEQKQASVEILKAWGAKNKARIKANAKVRYIENRVELNERSAAWARDNPERQRERTARYHAENPHKANHRARVRRDKLAHSKPKWANDEAIRAIYLQAAEFRAAGIDVEVDHFYPLQGEFVSGLHCEANLQIITAHENRSKQNRYAP